ncbi:MAG: enoyl-CoA hydratase/isomerase family protein [Actinomycetales bacterium]|nr:enoyl-CoA hydratase/isomerase family protein [Actinomycetales bacterium]
MANPAEPSDHPAPIGGPTAGDDHVDYRIDGAVAIITLNRPDRLNAILPPMLAAYGQCLRQADRDPQVRAIVITGAGRGFCAGADLQVLAQGPAALTGYLAGQDLDSMPTAALHLAKPVVAAINGPCAGLGFVLAISADVRFASPTATMSTSFSRLGLVAEYGVAWLLPRLVGLPAATEILLSGRTIQADEAYRLGLVTALDDDVVARAITWAREVAATCSPSSIREIKAQLLAAQAEGLDDAVRASLQRMAASFAGPDLAEALAARAEKRPVRFPAIGTID